MKENIFDKLEWAKWTIRKSRKENGWSQAELGRRCGFSRQKISALENSRLPIPLETLFHVYKVLGVNFTITGSKEPPPAQTSRQ